MASRYVAKYTVPSGLPETIHDFAYEVIQHNPKDLVTFGAHYFHCMASGLEFNVNDINWDAKVIVDSVVENEQNIQEQNSLENETMKSQTSRQTENYLAKQCIDEIQTEVLDRAQSSEESRQKLLKEEKKYSLQELNSKPQMLDEFQKEIFALMDKDHNGTIDYQEFNSFMRSICTILKEDAPDKQQIKLAFKFIDLDENKTLNYVEIKQTLLQLVRIITGDLKGRLEYLPILVDNEQDDKKFRAAFQVGGKGIQTKLKWEDFPGFINNIFKQYNMTPPTLEDIKSALELQATLDELNWYDAQRYAQSVITTMCKTSGFI